MQVVRNPHLHLLPSTGDQGPASDPPGCRVAGCTAAATARLGFCAACALRYDAIALRRGRLVEGLCARLGSIGDPLYAAFGSRRRELGAHVLAHLEEMNAIDLHVPRAAVADLIGEIDAHARGRR